MFIVYDTTQKDEWNSIVKSFENYDVYYLHGYVMGFNLHGDGEPLLLYFSEKNMRAINVVMKRDISNDANFSNLIPKRSYYDLKTPYGYGGWIFEGNITEENEMLLEKDYIAWCKENGIVSEWCRFHPVISNVDNIINMYKKVFMGNTVAIKLDNEDAIWGRYSSKNRGHIRVAEKEGVTVRIEKSKEAFDVFKKIYKTTMDNDDANAYYYFNDEFYESIRNDLDGNYQLFTAYLNEIPIASSIMMFAGKYMTYHLSGQLFEYRRYSGTSMILNEAAKWGCRNGYEWLHLGGGLGAQEGPLYDFKKSFYKKGEDKKYFVGELIIDEEKYQYLVDLRGEGIAKDYFPRYRVI